MTEMTRRSARPGWGHTPRGWRSGLGWRGREERRGGGQRLVAGGAGYERGQGGPAGAAARRRG